MVVRCSEALGPVWNQTDKITKNLGGFGKASVDDCSERVREPTRLRRRKSMQRPC